MRIRVEAGDPLQVQQHRGVDVAGAGAHHEALERGHPHARLDRAAARHGARGGPVAEVQHDHAEVLDGALEELGRRARHEPVRGAVESVAAHPVLRGELPIDRVRVRRGRQRLVEGRVEHRDMRHVGERPLGRHDAGEVRGVVQRRQHLELLDVALHPVGDHRGLEEPRAALHHAVADGDGRMLVERRSVLGERLEHAREGGVVVGHGDVDPVRLVSGIRPGRRRMPHGVRRATLGLPDPLDQPAREGLARLDVDQLVLHRGRARVDDEDDAHEASAAWIAVMATVFTMSCTSAPRERSLMGLLRPCSTGPIATAPDERCTAL